MTFLERFYDNTNTLATKIVSGDFWRINVMALCALVVVLSFFNNLSPLKSFKEFYTTTVVNRTEYFLYETVKDRAADLTRNFDYPPYSGKESRTFRLVVPLFVKFTGIKHISIAMYLIQLVLGLVFFYLLTGFIYELLGDRVSTLYAMLGIAGIYLGACFFIDNAGYGDLFSFLFLFLAIFFRKKPLLIFIFLQLAFWNDERAFVASGLAFVWLWWYPQYLAAGVAGRFRVAIDLNMLMVVLAWGLWYAGRMYLMHNVGMKPTYNPDGEFALRIQQSIESLGFRLLWQFEGWWLIFLLAGGILWSKRQYLSLAAIGAAAAASMGGALIIYDSTRSGNFAFIILFFALAILKEELTQRQLRWVLMLIALLCLLHPLANKTHGVGFFLM